MKILIYGDSNTWGQVPNINGYCKDVVIKQYNKEDIWWHELLKNHDIMVNGLPGRAINNENPWLEGRNATKTIAEDLKGLNLDVVIIQLGTNDCKTRYNLSPNEITENLENLIEFIKKQTKAKIIIISPAIIEEGNKITDKYYVGAEEKSTELDIFYRRLALKRNYGFVSGKELEVGEDGEHLTKAGHRLLGVRVKNIIEQIIEEDELE